MSADNFIAVIRSGDRWYISHGFMSPLCEDGPTYVNLLVASAQQERSTRADALVAAHDLAHKMPVLEYGVIEL